MKKIIQVFFVSVNIFIFCCGLFFIFIPCLIYNNQVVPSAYFFVIHRNYCGRNRNQKSKMSYVKIRGTATFHTRENESKQIDQTTCGDVKSGIPRFSHGDHKLARLRQVIPVPVSPERRRKAVRMRDKGD